MTELRFSGTVDAVAGGGARVAVEGDVRGAFGEARPLVEGTVNGHAYRSRLAVYGGVTYLGLTKAFRGDAGLEFGDQVKIVLRRDEAPRELQVPSELQRALDAAPDVRDRFEAMAFTHRREYTKWVGEAKRQETRDRRAGQAIKMLREGLVTP